jgi:hypothetical protein
VRIPFIETIWEKFLLWGFHQSRIDFYKDWAKSIQARELFVTFLKEEIAISSSKQTRDRFRAFGLQTMLDRVVRGDAVTPSEYVGLSMPLGDMVLLSAADSAADEDLVTIIGDLVTALENQQGAVKTIVQAMVSPLVLIPGVGAFAYILSSKSIPVIEKIAPPEVWTPFNDSVRGVANFINNYGLLFLFLSVVFIFGFSYCLPRWTGKLRLSLEQVNPAISVWLTPIAPYLLPLSIYRDFQALMLLSSLAVLLKTGKTLNEALEIISSRASPYLRYHVKRILNYIEEYPLEVSVAFTSGILSPKVSARLATIARTIPAYERVLIEIGTLGSIEIRNQVKKSAVLLNAIFISLAISLAMFLYVGQLMITQSLNRALDPTTALQRKDT